VKVVFLDIDGVLNTHKSALLYGNLFIETPGVAKKLDPYGSLFIKRLTQHGVKIVLSSTWRMGERFKRLAPQAFDFDILDRTAIYPFAKAIRGDEVQLWLDQHPEVTHYCIIDDDSDMLAQQFPHFVHTNRDEGITFANMAKVCAILGFDVWDLTAYRKEPELSIDELAGADLPVSL